jgi:hypothetical protein
MVWYIEMMHGQLKIKYPDCPFVWDYNDQTVMFQPDKQSMGRDDLFKMIIDRMVLDSESDASRESDSRESRSTYIDRDIMKFLIDISDPVKINQVFDNVKYTYIRQTIPKYKKDLWLNFHTTTYCTDVDPLLTKEYETNISWCFIPIVPQNNGILPYETDNYLFDQKNKKNNIQPNIVGINYLDPTTYQKNADTIYGKGAQIVTNRLASRQLIRRDDPIVVKPKGDQFVDNNNLIIGRTISPRLEQIELTGRTRQSASLIRERLLSSYKVNRMKGNPVLLEQQKRVDLSVRGTSNLTAHINNARYKENIKTVPYKLFDYLDEPIKINKTNGILRFGPQTTGRLAVNQDISSELFFVSVLVHKNNLHITYHHLCRSN